MNRIVSLALAAPLFGLFACTAPVGGRIGTTSEASSSSSTVNTAAVLALVDYPDTDETLLDVTIGLDSRAANNIIAKRDGADGIYPSTDDAPFATLAALEAVPYVKSSAVSKLSAYAALHPAPEGETVETVSFSGWQSVAVVWGVNGATEPELDAFLDTRAAKALVAGRPFASVAAMGPMAYVGPKALAALEAHALGWWNAMKAPPVFVLDATTLADDAEMLKESLPEDEGFAEFLITLGGNHSEGVAIVTALLNEIDVLVAPLVGTTYTDADAAEAAVYAAAPVKALTESGGWSYLESIGVTPPAVMACVASFEVSVIPHLGDLLFMSESDRPFDVVFYPGAGTAAPTAASVLALVNAPAGSTASVRPTGDYYVAFEPSGSGADPVAATDVTTTFGTLTDVTYVAVFAPPGSINVALVDVYLVGRTSCSDLVGIHAIAVET